MYKTATDLLERCQLKRKGGNVALDCCKELISRGYKIEFHITGMRQLSQEIYELSWVHNHGFLDKTILTNIANS